MKGRTIHLRATEPFRTWDLTACGIPRHDHRHADKPVRDFALTDDVLAVTCGNCKRTAAFADELEEEDGLSREASRCAERDPGRIDDGRA